MRILFDARAVQDRCDGLGNHVRHLLTSLLRLDTENDYLILLGPAMERHLAQAKLLDRPKVRTVLTSIPFMGASQQLRVPWLVRRLPRSDVYHYPHFDMPLFAHPRSVVTIHDLNHVCFSGYFHSMRRIKQSYSFMTTRLSLAAARHIIAVSNTTKSEVLKRFPWLSPHKVTAIHFGLTERFQTPADAEQVKRFREKFHLAHDRFLLYVGTDRPHKNVDRLLSAYERLRRQTILTHKLLLIGSSQQDARLREILAQRRLNGSVVHLGYVPEEDLPAAYQVSDALVFCSLSEGFGLPLLEAMGTGVPVITSNIGATAEVVGDSAVLVDPFSVEAIAEGMVKVLSSETLRRQLVARGAERVQRFRLEETARNTLAVYRMAAGH